jgi:hypothetical protein
VLLLRGKPSPTVINVPAPLPTAAPSPVPHPGPVQRSLHVESVPTGARVLWGEKVLGQTPLDTRVEAGDAPPHLVLRADGYATAEVDAQLQGDALSARAELKRLAPTPIEAPAPSNPPSQKSGHTKKKGGGNGSSAPSGYKDDPYK